MTDESVPGVGLADAIDQVRSELAAAIESGQPLFSFGDYNRANKLPYTLNQTLDGPLSGRTGPTRIRGGSHGHQERRGWHPGLGSLPRSQG